MKLIHSLVFNQDKELEKFLVDNGYPLKIFESASPNIRMVRCNISDDDKNWATINKLKSADTWDQTGIIYDKIDYNKSNWFILNTSESAYPQPDGNFDFIKYSYDQSHYCQKCQLGLIQQNPIRLKSDIKNKTHPLLGLHWVFDIILARREAIEVFKKNNVSGVTYTSVIQHSTNKEIDNLFQVKIDNQIELDIDDPEKLNQKCPTCGQIKHHYPRKHAINVHTQDLNNISSDVVQSKEYIGDSPHRLNLISKHLFNLITDLGWKGIKLQPVFQL